MLLLKIPSIMDLDPQFGCCHIYTGNCASVLENCEDVFSKSGRIEMTRLPQLGLF